MRLLVSLLLCGVLSAGVSAQTIVTASTIIDKINDGQPVSYENVIITGTLDLTDLKNRELTDKNSKWWGNDYHKYESSVEVPLRFENCKFEGDVIAYYHKESDNNTFIAHFEEDVVFRNCVFVGAAEFKYSEFEGRIDFSGAHFDEDANFKYAAFEEGPDFTKVRFQDDANFKYAEFPKRTSFSEAVFEEEANFKYAEFPGGATFAGARFLELANFKYTKFKNPLDMKEVQFEGSEDFKYTQVDGQSFSSYLIRNQ